jgi:hypothetical protein
MHMHIAQLTYIIQYCWCSNFKVEVIPNSFCYSKYSGLTTAYIFWTYKRFKYPGLTTSVNHSFKYSGLTTA